VGIWIFEWSSQISAENTHALSGTLDISPQCFLAKITTFAALLPIANPCSFLGNAPLLTVAAEVQLYIFYGFVFFKGGERLVLIACAVSMMLGLIVSALSSNYPILYNWWQNSSSLAFLPYWWIGAAATIPPIRGWISRNVSLIASGWLLLTILANYIDTSGLSAELRKASFALLMAWLIVKFDAAQLRNNPLSFLGRAGYSIYAFHAPTAILMCVSGYPWWQVVTFALGSGMIAYYALERPFDRFGHSMSARYHRAKESLPAL
jgi:hypothetical protein